MWVFTSFGFFSVVQHRARPDHVLVRARDRADLVALVKRVGKPKPAIRHTPAADYPYRLELAKGRFASFMSSIALELDYPNFKGAVAERQGYERAAVYHDVWAKLRSIEVPGIASFTPPDADATSSQ